MPKEPILMRQLPSAIYSGVLWKCLAEVRRRSEREHFDALVREVIRAFLHLLSDIKFSVRNIFFIYHEINARND